uniref:Uncharacterized protein n=1 Tax=viral metagenome TaxID=1070528 RepID=A0A6C0DS89_9ZZZZ
MSSVALTSQEEAVFRFLFQLQESGETNMFDAPKYVLRDPRFAAMPIGTVRALRDRWMTEWEELRLQLKIDEASA